MFLSYNFIWKLSLIKIKKDCLTELWSTFFSWILRDKRSEKRSVRSVEVFPTFLRIRGTILRWWNVSNVNFCLSFKNEKVWFEQIVSILCVSTKEWRRRNLCRWPNKLRHMHEHHGSTPLWLRRIPPGLQCPRASIARPLHQPCNIQSQINPRNWDNGK